MATTVTTTTITSSYSSYAIICIPLTQHRMMYEGEFIFRTTSTPRVYFMFLIRYFPRIHLTSLFLVSGPVSAAKGFRNLRVRKASLALQRDFFYFTKKLFSTNPFRCQISTTPPVGYSVMFSVVGKWESRFQSGFERIFHCCNWNFEHVKKLTLKLQLFSQSDCERLDSFTVSVFDNVMLIANFLFILVR